MQAELSNTLRRRKPVVIDEPPKYEYPIYDEPPTLAKANESSTARTIQSSPLISSSINSSDKESINNNKNNKCQPIVKPSNVNAILSVVTGIKIPANIQFDTNNGINKAAKPTTATATTTTVAPTTDKPPKISHGKPNFIINRNDSASALIKQIEKDSFKPNEHKIVHTTKFSAPNKMECQSTVLPKPKLHAINSVLGAVDKFKPVKTIAAPIIPADTGNELKSYGEVSSTLKKFNAMKSKPMDAPISTVSNRISFVPVNNLVANKKALFEQQQSIDGEKSSALHQTKKLPATKTYSHNDIQPNNGPSKIFAIHQNLNRTASAEHYQRSAFDSDPISMNKNAIKTMGSTTTTTTTTKVPINVSGISKATTNGDTDQNGFFGYRKQMSTLHSTKSIDTKNFEQKTIVSFSKDLLNVPNMYPEQIRVVKKAIITTETHHFPDNGIESAANFQNIRFSIGPNAQVVSKKK